MKSDGAAWCAAGKLFIIMLLDIEERTTRVNINGYNGTYHSTGVLLASTVTW